MPLTSAYSPIPVVSVVQSVVTSSSSHRLSLSCIETSLARQTHRTWSPGRERRRDTAQGGMGETRPVFGGSASYGFVASPAIVRGGQQRPANRRAPHVYRPS